MTKTSTDNLETWRNIAQAVTIGSAVLYGLSWLVTQGITSLTLTIMQNTLLAVMIAGGVAMGLLYQAHLTRRNRRRR